MFSMPSKSPVVATAPGRVLSIDVLRGITIAFMILVNDPGDSSHAYAQLDHAKWSGWTLTDLVFPTFLFLVGAAIILSLQSRIRRGESRRGLALHMVRRSAIIFALDMFFGLFPHFNFAHLRIYGVLTRIAVCYLCAGIICLFTQKAAKLLAICAVLLVGYWALMRFVAVPGFGVPTHDMPLLDPVRNLTAWIDRGFTDFLQRTIHTGRLYLKTSDPEGILSTLPAIATVLLGSVAALWMRRVDGKAGSITQVQCAIGLLVWGVLSIAAGLVWNIWFPINKNLWTSSFVLFAAGCSLVGLAACYWAVDIRRIHETKVGGWLTWPWLVFGSNAIVAYCMADLLVATASWIRVQDGGQSITLWRWIYVHLFASGGSTAVTSLLFAISFVIVCFLPNVLLWRKKIFVKI